MSEPSDEREALSQALAWHISNREARELMADAILAAGFRRTMQGEPTDAAILAFSNNFYGYDPPVIDLDYWAPTHVAKVRAALRAAAAVQGGETR